MAQVHYVVRPNDLNAEFGRWSLQSAVDCREWDDEVVVRVEQSGATYLLSALAGATLQALRNGAAYGEEIAASVFSDGASPGAVTAALAARFSGSAPEMQRVQETLVQLQSIGVVRSDLK